MTIDMDATTETIDAMQLSGDYEGIREVMIYAAKVLLNDGKEIIGKSAEIY